MFEINKNTELWKTYLPLAKKQEIAEHIAENALCRYRSSISYGEDLAFDPAIYEEDTATRWRYMMGVLFKFYLGVEFEPVAGEEYLLSQDDYDRAASLHPMNGLERMKSDAAMRDKVFDLLRDYKDTERMVSAEIAAQIAARNDSLPRFLSVLTQTATPQALAELSKMEKALGAQAKATAEAVKAAQTEIRQQ